MNLILDPTVERPEWASKKSKIGFGIASNSFLGPARHF